MSNPTQTFGVAGCGDMGLPMAKALVSAGFEVYGFDIRPPEQFGNFSTKMITVPDQFVQTCDIIVCVVRDTKQVLDLCFESQGIFNNPTPTKTFVLSSTTPPDFVHTLASRLPENITLIDAPMSGAPQAAIAKTLTFMVGGPEKTVEKLRPAFNAMGNKTFHLGDLGTGMTTKVLNNFVAASSVVAVRNVLHHAAKMGVAPASLLSVMDQSSGQTWFGSNFEKTVWAKQQYNRENTIGILEKDVNAFITTLTDGPEPLHTAIINALQSLPRVPS